jgi:hypothetical protein
MRERALKIVLVLVGLLFVAAIYPVTMSLWHPSPSDDTGDTMMMSLYFTLGVFLLVAARKPSAHRSLIAFAALSSFAHAVVMAGDGIPEGGRARNETKAELSRLASKSYSRRPDRNGCCKRNGPAKFFAQFALALIFAWA